MGNDYPDKHHSRRSDIVVLRSIKKKFKEERGREPDYRDTPHIESKLGEHGIHFSESNATSSRSFLEAAVKKGISFLFRSKPRPRDETGD